MPINNIFFPSQTATENSNKSKAEYTNTQQDLTDRWCQITNSLDMQSFWLVDILLKSNKEYVVTFKILAQNSSSFIITK
jgi:hypothetical protein